MRGSAGLLSPLLVLLAVGLLASGCESENAVACQRFVGTYASLPCAAGTDPGVDCNAFADYPCPIDDYFTCLEGAYSCNEAGDLEVDLGLDAGPGQPATCADLLDCEG